MKNKKLMKIFLVLSTIFILMFVLGRVVDAKVIDTIDITSQSLLLGHYFPH
ncbi:MAG: hypothetical protein ACD_26C00034G0106 [uncultured bacterium]|nr:MAG: hypothetical protein ACD_26C00034G0106 [uncultured bacterium]